MKQPDHTGKISGGEADFREAKIADPHWDILSMDIKELEAVLTTLGEKPFRAKQLFQWLHQKHVVDFDCMTNLSGTLREKLRKTAVLQTVKIEKKLISHIDNTIKYLFKLQGSTIIESVFMEYSHGHTVCVTSQAGCRMGCAFCASAVGSLDRNLTAGEMVAQIYEIQKDTGKRISGFVIMGSGEPLDNYDSVLKCIRLLNDREGLAIGQRHITLSTCGLVPDIYRLSEENLQITLAVSLHAPVDSLRSTLMPINRKYPVDEVLKAAKFYAEKTKRRVTIEYALISGVNDSMSMAEILGKKLKGSLTHVNLIPFNAIAEKDFKRSSWPVITAFAEKLRSFGVETTVRRELGGDIHGACGQLRKSHIQNR